LVALQAEYHPYLDQSKLLAAVRQRGMAFVAYCPLGRGRLFSDPVLTEIAKTRGKSIAQVALRWLMQQNVAAIPRSSNPERIADNAKVFDFTLSGAEMARIAALKRPDGRIANPVERVSGGWD
jgi:diketogulonate reductase-like aldo/keto reductase